MAINWLGTNKGGKGTTSKELINSEPNSSKILIFLDTNFIMALAQMQGLHFSHEFDRVIPGKRELIVLTPILKELQKLNREGTPKVKMESRMAIEYVQKFCNSEESEYKHKNVDFILLHNGEKRKGIIATNDRKLKRLAQKKGIRTLYIRNKSFFELK
ncbi:MAG: PIN domain-containing protein [Candidatus Hodarchaeales archaeon]|jgi:rRNA-processing protein FCF1